MRRILRRILLRIVPPCMAAALALGAGPGIGAPFTVEIGDARIVLDAPVGFADTSFIASPRLAELAESLTSASNRILLFAISDADLRRFSLGDPPDFRRYLLAGSPRSLEHIRVGPQAFASHVEETLRELGKVPQVTDYFSYLDGQPRGRGSLLAELRRSPQAVAVLQGTRLPALTKRAEEPARYVLSSLALVRLRGKALNLALFSVYEGPDDLAWIRSATTRWIDELERLNER